MSIEKNKSVHDDSHIKSDNVSLAEANGSIIVGRNAVMEALRAGVTIDKVFIAKGETDATLRRVVAAVREAGASVSEADRRKLDSLCSEYGIESGRNHQGVVAMAAVTEYSTVEDILADAEQKNQKPLIVICDEITYTHNLGAIIRTSEAAGSHGVIIQKHRNVGLTAAVAKTSGGAVFHMKVARVPNITAVIRELKKLGIWIFGAVAEGETLLWDADFTGATALVIGSEGKGISRLVRDNCDYKVRIPMDGRLSSLNASVSASILLYEAYRQSR